MFEKFTSEYRFYNIHLLDRKSLQSGEFIEKALHLIDS